MMNETGPENKVSRVNASGFRGRVCPCCINLDRKGRPLSFGFHTVGTKDDDWNKPIHRILGRKGKTLRDHRA